MATSMKRIPARASETLQRMIRSAGPVSAATRALLWLGADAAGLPIPLAGRREIAVLLAEEGLAPAMLVALQHLYDRLPSGAVGDTRGAAVGDTRGAAVGDTRGAAMCATFRAGASILPFASAELDTAADADDPFADIGRAFDG